MLLKAKLHNIRDNLPYLLKKASTKAENLLLEPPSEKNKTENPTGLHYDGKSGAQQDESVDLIFISDGDERKFSPMAGEVFRLYALEEAA